MLSIISCESVTGHTSDSGTWPMHPVVFTDLAERGETDTHVCGAGAVFDHENSQALVEDGSLQGALDTDLCLDVFYALVGCGIAYVMVS
jgi:hypothetical protein